MVGILIDGVLHLAKQVVELNKVLLRSGVGHWQIILLSKRVLRWRRAVMNHYRCWLRHVLFRSRHGTIGNGERAVKGQERASNLGV